MGGAIGGAVAQMVFMMREDEKRVMEAREKKRKPDPLKPGTEVFVKRQARHKHNGFSGTVAMALSGMNAIIKASTTTPEAKKMANDIWIKLDELREELKKRVD